jgi:hypothetical protein
MFGLDLFGRLFPRLFPFMGVDFPVLVPVEAGQQPGFVLLPFGKQVSDILAQIEFRVGAADGYEIADGVQGIAGHQQPLGMAVFPLPPAIAVAGVDFRAVGVDDAFAAAVVQQKGIVGPALLHHFPLIAVFPFDLVLAPQAGPSGGFAGQLLAGKRLALPHQFQIALGGGSHAGGGGVLDQAGAAQIARPRDEAQQGHRP